MTTDTLLQKVVAFTTPTTCLLCSKEPTLLCEDCYSRALPPLPPQKPIAVTAYDDIGKELIRRFKFDGDQEAGRLCARYMAEMVRAEDYDVVTAATTTPARRRQRGYDQSVLLAKWTAKHLGIPYLPTLVRIKSVHQIGAGRAQRLEQSEGLYVATRRVEGRILLIDDVITTGATLAAAAAALMQAGAETVEGLVFVRDELASGVRSNQRLAAY